MSKVKNKPKVTIVIPTFNRSELLQKAIESSLNQTYPCEIIVCDHGSSDNTPTLMKKYKNKIFYIRKEKDFGPHFCWLDGILQAKTDFIHLQFDDDWIDKTYIERCMKLMQDEVGVVIAEASVYWESSISNNIFNFKKVFKTSGIFSSKKLEKLLLRGSMYTPAASLFRKKDMLDALYQGNLPVSKYRGYHGVGPDSFFTLLAILRYKKVGIITDALVGLYAHDSSITIDAKKNPQKQLQIQNAYRNVLLYYRFLKWYPIFYKFYHVFSKFYRFIFSKFKK